MNTFGSCVFNSKALFGEN